MGYEVDFLAVGDGERSGDAIALRYGNIFGRREEQQVIVIDGGTKDSGRRLVEHIKTYYGTGYVDLVISTHPDGDHCAGLTEVLEGLDVRLLAMHRPWEHAVEIRDLFRDGRLTDASLAAHIWEALQSARDLEAMALDKGIPIVEPFQGDKTSDGIVTILGPSEADYLSLVPHFRGTPEASEPLLEKAFRLAKEAVRWVQESLDPRSETLDDSGETTPENNSSVILLVNTPDGKLLFTGDAGISALAAAADYANGYGIDLRYLRIFQVPHHGSRHNLGPTILSRIGGTYSLISASKDADPKHPSRRVVNALIRRGSTVVATRGVQHCDCVNSPGRNWGPATPLPFFNLVEG